MGQQVGGQALEHLGLVEAEFTFGTEQTRGSYLVSFGRLPVGPPYHSILVSRSRSLVSVTEFIPEAQQRGSILFTSQPVFQDFPALPGGTGLQHFHLSPPDSKPSLVELLVDST